MMSGKVHQRRCQPGAGATAHGGLLVIEGDAASRCGISMKGIDIVVGGSSATCRPSWRRPATVVCGDAGDALGDALRSPLFVRAR
jgi:glutamate synthase domain-containing protein 3